MTTLETEVLPASLVERVVATAAGHADDVDRAGRFPQETLDALRAARLLALLVPTELGGLGGEVRDAAALCRALGTACSSSSLILAMHHIQVACLVRHGETPELQDLLRRVADEQLLLASATTEIGIGGDTRSSTCAVTEGRIDKQAPVISYGAHADGVLVTARRDPEASASEQVLVAALRADLALTEVGTWDTVGFRGTRSTGFVLSAAVVPGHVLTDDFGVISQRTMLPVSHVLWASTWLGMADEAVRRAGVAARRAARKAVGTTTPAAQRFAELAIVHQQLGEVVEGSLRRYEDAAGDPDRLASPSFVAGMNSLKVGASDLLVRITTEALGVTGISGYREDSDVALGRLLRDSLGAGLMVSNDRILANNARLLMAAR